VCPWFRAQQGGSERPGLPCGLVAGDDGGYAAERGRAVADIAGETAEECSRVVVTPAGRAVIKGESKSVSAGSDA